jgi:DICT domain-containing protein
MKMESCQGRFSTSFDIEVLVLSEYKGQPSDGVLLIINQRYWGVVISRDTHAEGTKRMLDLKRKFYC